MLPETDQRRQDIARLQRTHRLDSRRVLPAPDAVAARARRPPSVAADDARLHRAAVHRLHRDPRRSPLCRRSRHRDCGLARYRDQEILVVGHQKGSDTKQKIYRNFGYARPEGYRKALRAMQMAQKFDRPIVCFVDTPAAYPGHRVRGARRRRGHRAQPARDGHARRCRSIVVVHGEGGSGGALGIAVGDRILMHEFAIYSVIPPGRLRRDSVARRRQEGRGRRGAEAHGAGPAGARHHRRDRARSRSAARTPTRRRRRRCSTRRSTRALDRGRGGRRRHPPRTALPEVPQDGLGRHRRGRR